MSPFRARSPCKTHGPSGPWAWPLVTHPTLQVASWAITRAVITVSRYIDACLLPLIRSLHSTHIHKHSKPYLHQKLSALGSSTHSTIQQQFTNQQPTSKCLPWLNSLLALALLQTGLCLLFPSEPSNTSDESEQSQQQSANVSRGDIACMPDVHLTLSIYQLPTPSIAPAYTLIASCKWAHSSIISHWIPTSSIRSMIRSMHGSAPTTSANQRSARHVLLLAFFGTPTCS